MPPRMAWMFVLPLGFVAQHAAAATELPAATKPISVTPAQSSSAPQSNPVVPSPAPAQPGAATPQTAVSGASPAPSSAESGVAASGVATSAGSSPASAETNTQQPSAPAATTSLAVAKPAPAETAAPRSTPLTKGEREVARRHFDRGLELYDAGDYTGALVEFQGALRVTRHPIVMYNIALVYAHLGAPVECTRAVEDLQRDGLQQLDISSRDHLKQIYEEQLTRIGRLRVKVSVNGALVQVDGVEVEADALDSIPVSAGEHIVSTLANGYIPRRLRVVVPAKAENEVTLNLQPLQTTLAHLHIVTDVPEVEVLVDKDVVGKTPFPASLAFAPGTHHVTLRRPGYQEQKQTVMLDPGGEGHLSFQMPLDEAALEREHGVLSLEVSEPNSLVSVNGKAIGTNRNKLRLPYGKHHLQVHSAGFVDYERDIVVPVGEITTRVELLPTSEFLKDYSERTRAQRLWGWIGTGAGLGLGLASAGYLIWNEGERKDAQTELDDFVDSVRRSPSGSCGNDTCDARVQTLGDHVDDAKQRAVFGWIGVGVGAALAATSVTVLLLSDDPDRYAPRPDSDVFGSLRLNVIGSPFGFFAGAQGRF